MTSRLEDEVTLPTVEEHSQEIGQSAEEIDKPTVKNLAQSAYCKKNICF